MAVPYTGTREPTPLNPLERGPNKPIFLPDDLKDKDIEEFLQTIPLMADIIPDDLSSHPDFAALEELRRLATPEEKAEEHRQNGNSAYRLGKSRWRDAIIFYSQGIDENCSDPKLNASLYANRAAVLINFENYGKAIKDCKESIKLDPTQSKPFFRAAKALQALRRWKEALEYCEQGKALPNLTLAEKKHFQILLKELSEKVKQEEEAKRKAEEEENARQKKDHRVQSAIAKRGIEISDEDVESHVADLKAAAITLDEKGVLHWPVSLLYPQYLQSDFIEKFSENHRFTDHLNNMFPPAMPYPSWDKQQQYRADNLEIYVLIKDKAVLVKPETTLYALLTKRDFKATKVLEVFLLPRDGSFKAEFLAKYK